MTGRESARPHVVVVGAGFGGLAAARALARSAVQVTLVDQTNFHLFQPLLYQVATAGLSPAEVAYPIRRVFRRRSNVDVVFGAVSRVDLDARTLCIGGRTVGYDYLVLAPGGCHAYFGHPEWEADAPGLKTIEDALEIRRRVLLAFEKADTESDPLIRRALLTFVIVGGGPTGVELAGAVAELACRVLPRDFHRMDTREARTILLEAGPRVLPAFPDDLSSRAESALRHRCVDVRTGTAVTDVGPGGVRTNRGEIPAGTVLWAAGVATAPVAGTLGVPVDRAGRVVVRPDLHLAGHGEVMVIGDAASVPGPDGRPLPALAPVAVQEGRHAARTIRRALRGRAPEAFRYRDRGSMATIGRGQAVAASGGWRFSGRTAWWVWLGVHLVWLIGFRNRAMVLVEWAWAYVANQRSGRLILAPFRLGVTPAASGPIGESRRTAA